MSNMAYFWTIVLLIAGVGFLIVEITVMIGAIFDIRSLGEVDPVAELEADDESVPEQR